MVTNARGKKAAQAALRRKVLTDVAASRSNRAIQNQEPFRPAVVAHRGLVLQKLPYLFTQTMFRSVTSLSRSLLWATRIVRSRQSRYISLRAHRSHRNGS